MQIAANQYLGGGSYEWHVIGRDVSVDINYSSRQYQLNEFGEYNGEGFCRRKAHDPNVGILQKRTDSRRVRRAEYPHSINLAII